MQSAAFALSGGVRMDGEVMGETLYPFVLLELKRSNLHGGVIIVPMR